MLFQVFFSQCHRSKSIEKYGTFETLIYGKCAKKEEILRQICQMSNLITVHNCWRCKLPLIHFVWVFGHICGHKITLPAVSGNAEQKLPISLVQMQSLISTPLYRMFKVVSILLSEKNYNCICLIVSMSNGVLI